MKASFYIASALFTPEQKARINSIALYLRARGCKVYVPHELSIPNAATMPNSEWARTVFINDLHALDSCDKVIYICEGMNGDIGAAWECGYAYAKGKDIAVVEVGNLEEPISLMVGQSCHIQHPMRYQS